MLFRSVVSFLFPFGFGACLVAQRAVGSQLGSRFQPVWLPAGPPCCGQRASQSRLGPGPRGTVESTVATEPGLAEPKRGTWARARETPRPFGNTRHLSPHRSLHSSLLFICSHRSLHSSLSVSAVPLRRLAIDSTAAISPSSTGHQPPQPPSLHRRFFVNEFVNGGKIIHTPRMPPNRLRSVDPWVLNCLP